MPPLPEHMATPMLRIIGVELRYRDPAGYQEEIAILPCNILVKANMGNGMAPTINATIHTSAGDTNFAGDARLPYGCEWGVMPR